MAEDKKNQAYEDDAEFITLEFEDGNEVEAEIMGIFDVDGKEYTEGSASTGTAFEFTSSGGSGGAPDGMPGDGQAPPDGGQGGQGGEPPEKPSGDNGGEPPAKPGN